MSIPHLAPVRVGNVLKPTKKSPEGEVNGSAMLYSQATSLATGGTTYSFHRAGTAQLCLDGRDQSEAENNGGRYSTTAVVDVPSACGAHGWVAVDARQRPATPASAWRSGIGRQLTGQPRLPRVRTTSRTLPAINNAVEVAPEAHSGQRRPSCVRVCCRTRAPRCTRCAPDRPAYYCDYPQFIETPDIHSTKADVAAF
ncbi:hypothetical protein EVAR_31955_1 [Eumeta japonica]|uniref:Uncharacterized protein n=1 Tax=Eumeta variegata TaxID=151549 RepID=A0A4C1VTX5_EUMVA|nr:hypothetical protein EVAR_31955_1 [Eumeta japonica]